MPKTIVIAIDGTADQFQVNATNVLRLAAMLVDEPGVQRCYYDPGVGTQGAPSTSLLNDGGALKLLDLGIGLGIYDKIGQAYRFLMAAYAPGDRIMLFGFSRGAYIARALAGMIHKIGVLDPLRGNLVPYAVKLYADPKNHDLAEQFAAAFCHRDPGIAFLGLWDTVKSVFALRYVPPGFTSTVLPYTYANPAVAVVRQALAIDERRRFYRTNLWNAADPQAAGQDVAQVWFAGGHCDIGGGTVPGEAGLALIALDWMLGEACRAGLLIDRRRALPVPAAADPLAAMHVALHGVTAWLPEYWPKRAETGPPGNRRTRWYLPRGEPRFIPEGALLHASVVARMHAGIGYLPVNLPLRYTVASTDS